MASNADLIFPTRDAAARWLAEQVHGWPLDDESRSGLVTCLADAVVSHEARRPRGGLGMVVGRYVIRDDDLSLLDALRAAVLAAAPTSFFLDAPTTASVTGLLAAVVTVADRLRRKGARLGPIPLHVLMCLRASPRRLSAAEVAHRLNAASDDRPWTVDEAERELVGLQSVPLGDGSVASLVSRDADGRWATAGV